MEVGSNGIAVITISSKTVNSAATSIIAWLKEHLEEAIRRDDVRAIVLIAENGIFYGEVDIINFQKVQQTGDFSLLPDVSVGLVLKTIEESKKPIVIAIEGYAVGVALEIAMGCHGRIATPKTKLRLPELSLWIIPGAGGTQRLPRLVGLQKAIDMMLTSELILSEEGEKLGLIDAIAPPRELLTVSSNWALDLAEKRQWVLSLDKTDKIGSVSEAKQIIKVARDEAKHAMPSFPHHLACLDVIEEGIVQGGRLGLVREGEVFKKLIVTDEAKDLFNRFFSQQATSKRSRL